MMAPHLGRYANLSLFATAQPGLLVAPLEGVRETPPLPSRTLATASKLDPLTGLSMTAQDSLPAAGQALPDGIGYPQGLGGGFK